MTSNPSVPVSLINVRGTELLSSDTRERYRQKLARITLDSMVQFVGLTNIHRHSGSKTATIRMVRDAHSVRMDVLDEGKGMSDEKLASIKAQRTGVGLTGIRERIRLFQGVVNVESSSRGTCVSVVLPLFNPAENQTP